MCLKIWSQALKKSTVQSAVATANDTTKVNATQVASPNALGNARVAADVNKKQGGEPLIFFGSLLFEREINYKGWKAIKG